MRVVYIAGSGRSGSTILGQMLGQIDGFFSVGEASNLWQRGLVEGRKCGCGRPVPDCPAWSAIVQRALGSVGESDARRLSDLARERDHVRSIPRVRVGRRTSPDAHDEYMQALGSLYDAIGQETRCRVIVDSSKSPIYAEMIDSIAAADVHVVHLVRDPRATAFSWLRRKPLPDFGDGRWMARQSPLVSARRWSKAQILTELLWRRRTGRYLFVRYEDLLRYPEGTLRKICALVGEDQVKPPLSDPITAQLEVTHSVSGNPGRFSDGAVKLRLDDEWLKSMRAQDRRIVTALTWPLLFRYGYALDPSRDRRPG